LILAGRALAYGWSASVEEERYQFSKYVEADQWIASQKAVLNEFSKADIPGEDGQAASSRLVIPIDRAVELVRPELTAESGT